MWQCSCCIFFPLFSLPSFQILFSKYLVHVSHLSPAGSQGKRGVSKRCCDSRWFAPLGRWSRYPPPAPWLAVELAFLGLLTIDSKSERDTFFDRRQESHIKIPSWKCWVLNLCFLQNSQLTSLICSEDQGQSLAQGQWSTGLVTLAQREWNDL